MVEAHTFSLAYVQRGSDEIELSDGELCSRCHEDVEWSEFVCQRTVLNNRHGLVNSSCHELQVYNRIEICRFRGTAFKQYHGSSEFKTLAICEIEPRWMKSRGKTRKIPDDEGTDRTTSKNVQAGENTPRPRKIESLPETGESRRLCSEIRWIEGDQER